MKKQFNHSILQSFLLYLDHKALEKGEAFTNVSGLLYKVPINQTNYYGYASPFRQLVNDTSISGANILSGVYLNGNFTTVGQSGMVGINHDLGVVYFTGTPIPTTTIVSGNYAVKEFSITINDQPEYKLMFETKYVSNSKFNQTLSGLPLDVKTAPAIFLKPQYFENKPGAFGGINDNTISIRATIIAENQFQKIGICNILQDLKNNWLPVVTSTPFDYRGSYTGLAYNYSGLPLDDQHNPLISEVRVIEIPTIDAENLQNLTTNVGIVDFTLSCFMKPV